MTLVARAGIAALVVCLVGCTSPMPPAPEQSSEMWSSATAAHGQLLNGNCKSLFGPGELAETYSEGPDASGQLTNSDPLFGVLGGIDCAYSLAWSGASDPDAGNFTSANLRVTVVPAAIAAAAAVRASVSPQSCVDGYFAKCMATGTVGEWWYELSLDGLSSAQARNAAFAAITTDLEAALADLEPTKEVAIVEPFDCSSVDVNGIPTTSSRVMPQGIAGTAISAAAFLLAGPVTCEFALPGSGAQEYDYWDLTVYPGSVSAFAQCAIAASQKVYVEGVLAAAELLSEDAYTLCATDGTSLVKVRQSIGGSSGTWQASALDTASTLLVPVFAAVAPSSSPWVAEAATVAASNDLDPFAGGECSKLFDATTISSAFNLSSEVVSVPKPLAVSTLGGIDCTYAVGGLEPSAAIVRVIVAPRAIVDSAELERSRAPKDCVELLSGGNIATPGCSVTDTIGGWWFSVSVSDFQTTQPLQPSFDAVLEALEQKLSAVAAPDAVTGVAPFNCDAVDAGGAPATSERVMAIEWGNHPAELLAAAFVLSGPVTCTYTVKNGAPWALTVYPGGASTYRACAEPGAMDYQPGPIALPGVKAAFGQVASNDGPQFCATDGTSTVEVNGYYETEMNSKSRAEIGSLLAAVFAAAD